MDKVKFNPDSEILAEDFNAVGAYTEQALKHIIADFINNETVVTGLTVKAQAVPDMTVYIEQGRIYQNGLQGELAGKSDALAIPASPLVGKRIDRICARYNAIEDTPETRNFIDVATKQIRSATIKTRIHGTIVFQVVAGAAGKEPAAPAVPDGWVSLGQVVVCAGAGVIQQTDILDERPTLKTLMTHGHTGANDGAVIEYNSLNNKPILHATNIPNNPVGNLETINLQDTLTGVFAVATSGKSVRNTVLAGPVSFDGRPLYLEKVSDTSIAVKTGTVISFSDGYDNNGPVEYIERIPQDLTAAINERAKKLYIYAERLSRGVVQLGSTGVKPVTNKRVANSYTFPDYLQLDTGDRLLFKYTGSPQVFNVPANVRKVKIECWGASGGTAYPNSSGKYFVAKPGYGGYACGELIITPSTQVLSVCVGQKGGIAPDNTPGGSGGWNGGGAGGPDTGNDGSNGGGGGGATDVRTGSDSSKRCIVAGGGGGASFDYKQAYFSQCVPPNGGDGGGYTGGQGSFGIAGNTQYNANGGTQNSGGTGSFGGTNGDTRGIGCGGDGIGLNTFAGGGGGGGFHGGAGGAGDGSKVINGIGVFAGGGGGSSYIAGDANCPTAHPDGIKLINTVTYAGVNVGDGYAVITILEAEPTENTHMYVNETGRMLCYQNNQWQGKQRVFVGEAAVDDSGKITSCKMYDYGTIHFARISTLAVDQLLCKEVGITGQIAYFATGSPPEGWLKANGAAVSKTVYRNLFNAIGYTFGGSGEMFCLPDLRGEFIRGFDDGRAVDYNRALGSWQAGTKITGDDGAGPAVHGIGNIANIDGDPTNNNPTDIYYVGTGASVSSTVYWRMTRPRNVALLACIKY